MYVYMQLYIKCMYAKKIVPHLFVDIMALPAAPLQLNSVVFTQVHVLPILFSSSCDFSASFPRLRVCFFVPSAYTHPGSFIVLKKNNTLETISLNPALSVLLLCWYLTGWSEQAWYTAHLLLFSGFRAPQPVSEYFSLIR